MEASDKQPGISDVDESALNDTDRKAFAMFKGEAWIWKLTLFYVGYVFIVMIASSRHVQVDWTGLAIKYLPYVALAFWGRTWSRIALVALLLWHSVLHYQLVLAAPLQMGTPFGTIFFWVFTIGLVWATSLCFSRAGWIRTKAQQAGATNRLRAAHRSSERKDDACS